MESLGLIFISVIVALMGVGMLRDAHRAKYRAMDAFAAVLLFALGSGAVGMSVVLLLLAAARHHGAL